MMPNRRVFLAGAIGGAPTTAVPPSVETSPRSSSNLAIANVPERWRAITKRRHPEALANPETYLEPLLKAL